MHLIVLYFKIISQSCAVAVTVAGTNCKPPAVLTDAPDSLLSTYLKVVISTGRPWVDWYITTASSHCTVAVTAAETTFKRPAVLPDAPEWPEHLIVFYSSRTCAVAVTVAGTTCKPPAVLFCGSIIHSSRHSWLRMGPPYIRISEILWNSIKKCGNIWRIFWNFWRAQLGKKERKCFLQGCDFPQICLHSRTAATYDLFNLILHVGVNPHPDMQDHVWIVTCRLLHPAIIIGPLPFSIFATSHTCSFSQIRILPSCTDTC